MTDKNILFLYIILINYFN